MPPTTPPSPPIPSSPPNRRPPRPARRATPHRSARTCSPSWAVRQDNSAWGAGVTVAVLDGGASPDATLGTRLKVSGHWIRQSSGPGGETAHATSVAALVAGASADARGLAPSASVLSIRVTGADGLSDTFSVAQGIYAAIAAGAQVINISLGGYATSTILGAAVEEALASGVAIVASSGNDQAARLVYPRRLLRCRPPSGAVDAAGLQAIFSNSGSGLQLTAPGYAIQTAGASGTRVSFSGTSASAARGRGSHRRRPLHHARPHRARSRRYPRHLRQRRRRSRRRSRLRSRLAQHGLDPWIAPTQPESIPPSPPKPYNRDTGTVSIVVQNRGAQTLTGLALTTTIDGISTTMQPLDPLDPGTSVALTVPIDRSQLNADGQIVVRSALVTPAGLLDQDTSNNRRSGPDLDALEALYT